MSRLASPLEGRRRGYKTVAAPTSITVRQAHEQALVPDRDCLEDHNQQRESHGQLREQVVVSDSEGEVNSMQEKCGYRRNSTLTYQPTCTFW